MFKRLLKDRILFLNRMDYLLLRVVLVLTAIGIVMVYSASSVRAMDTLGNPHFYLFGHLIRVAIGIVAMLFFATYDYHKLRRYVWVGLILVLVSLVVVLFTAPHSDVHRWIKIGSFQFQPSDFARLVLVLFIADFVARNRNRRTEFRRFLLPLCLVSGAIIVLVLLEPNYGTAVAIFALFLGMLYLCDVPLLKIAGVAFAGVLGIVAKMFLTPKSSAYAIERIEALIGGKIPSNVLQSLIAFASGALFGSGFGKQKMYFLPRPHTDFIFSVIGEEFGLVGTTLVLVLFLCVFYRGLKISLHSRDYFGTLLGFGLTVMITLYAILNMAVSLGMFPVTGLPLPFLSYGGTALLVNFISVGILLNISSQVSVPLNDSVLARREGNVRFRT
ncbi:cell division protein FtsW [bacterium]|nr:cell division protein FtsW [bacterium]